MRTRLFIRIIFICLMALVLVQCLSFRRAVRKESLITTTTVQLQLIIPVPKPLKNLEGPQPKPIPIPTTTIREPIKEIVPLVVPDPIQIDCNGSPEWFTDELLRQAGWPDSQFVKLCHVVRCESGFNPNAINHFNGGHRGLLQIQGYSWRKWYNSMGWNDQDMFDPIINLTFGRWVFEQNNQSHGTEEIWYSSSQGGWDCWKA